MLLSSILISSSPDEAADLPPIVRENIASLTDRHPGHEHRLFLEADILPIIRDRFPTEVWDAYQALRPYSYRADLARYCILHEFGGLYADLSYYFVRGLKPQLDKPLVFRGNFVSAPWDTSNGIIYAPRRHPALKRAIELVCGSVARRYYGTTPLCPTGPAMFGKALAEACYPDELISGLATFHPAEEVAGWVPGLRLPDSGTIHCQHLKRQLLAIKRKHPHDDGIATLGIATGNSYRDLWKAREVYE